MNNRNRVNRDELTRLTNASDFDDLLRDLRRSCSGAPAEVRDLVSQVVSHPAVDQLVRVHFSSSSTTSSVCRPTTTTGTGRPTTAGLGLASVTTGSASSASASMPTSGINEELARAFRPTGGFGFTGRSRRNGRKNAPATTSTMSTHPPIPRAEKAKKVKTIQRDMILLDAMMTTKPVDKRLFYNSGRVANCVKIDTSMTAGDVTAMVMSFFSEKLQHLPDPKFTFVKCEKNAVLKPKFSATTEMNGETVVNLCGAGQVYVMATGRIGDSFDPSIYIEGGLCASDSDDSDLPAVLPPQSETVRKMPRLSLQHSSSVSDISSETLLSAGQETAPQPPAVTSATSTCTYSQYLDLGVEYHHEEDEEEDDDINLAIIASLQEDNGVGKDTSLACELTKLQSKINDENSSKFNINRQLVLEGALRGFRRKTYSPFNRMSVIFTDTKSVGEGAIDVGGPTREFLRLLMRELEESCIFEGPPHNKFLALNASAMSDDLYYMAGRIIAVSLIHGGPPPGFFSGTLYECIVSNNLAGRTITPTVDEITDSDVQSQVRKIRDASTMTQLQAAVNEASSFLSLAGCLAPVKCVGDGHRIANRAAHFYVVDRLRSPLERFKDGLKTLGLLDSIHANKHLYKDIFCCQPTTLTAGMLVDIFEVDFSPKDSNKYRSESKVLGWWRDLLQDIAEDDAGVKDEDSQEPMKVSLKDVLIFATGADQVPPLGFHPVPTISFIYEAPVIDGKVCKHFPTASTCALQLRLPVTPTYEVFKRNVVLGIACSPGFGFA